MTEKEIVKLWQDNRKEMRCKQWFIDNAPEAVAWAEKNKKHIIVMIKNTSLVAPYSWITGCDFNSPAHIYSTIQNFTLQQERWWYCNDGTGVGLGTASPCKHCVEVPLADLPHVRAQIERHEKGEIDLREWDFRMVKHGETFIGYNGVVSHNFGSKQCVMLFVRKAEAKKVGGWKEYDVTIRDGKYYEVRVGHIPDICSLFEMPSIVGFAGYKFQRKDGSTTDWLFQSGYYESKNEGEPCKCIRVRFYVEDSK